LPPGENIPEKNEEERELMRMKFHVTRSMPDASPSLNTSRWRRSRRKDTKRQDARHTFIQY
jgi:hypothetical protein